MMWDGTIGWHWLGGLGMLFFWVLIILLVLAALKYLRFDRSDATGADRGKTALDYLDEAYARGEISREEFLQKRADLKR